MIKKKDTLQKYTMLLALLLIMFLFQILILSNGKGSLFAPSNITNLVSQNGYVVILATGMLMCILTGGNIDLAVGSTVALVGAIAGKLIVDMKMNIFLSIVLCLLVGIVLGAWQAFWIAYIRIPAFIVTLSGMLMFRGVALIILNGLTISPFPEEYTKYFSSYLFKNPATRLQLSLLVGAVLCAVMIVMEFMSRARKIKKGYRTEAVLVTVAKLAIISVTIMIGFYLLGKDKGIPVILILLGVIVFAYSYFTSNTVPGRYLYAMGGNEKAAKLSGVNTNKVMFFAYTNMGFLAAVAALVSVSRFNSATPSAGTNYEMDAIAACYIGGASAYGGVGKVGGAVIGAIFMGVLNNGMSILGIDSNWQRTVKGGVLLAAVAVDVITKKRNRAS